jgi:hypothetical protein
MNNDLSNPNGKFLPYFGIVGFHHGDITIIT